MASFFLWPARETGTGHGERCPEWLIGDHEHASRSGPTGPTQVQILPSPRDGLFTAFLARAEEKRAEGEVPVPSVP
ncbi:hypothetical protein SGPA1_21504 [Streptomyces misionensis JCM 4497]